VTIAECCFDTNGMGAEVAVPAVKLSAGGAIADAAALFGESASRAVLSAAPDAVTGILERAAALHVPARVIGQTGGNRIRMAVEGRVLIDVAVDEAEKVWATAIESYFVKRVA